MSDKPLPVARYSPAKGIYITRTDTEFRISGKMELYGPEATPLRARMIQNTINQVWTRAFQDGYKVNCNITVRYRANGTNAGNASQIEALKTSGVSHVNTLTKEMTLNANEQDVFNWTPAHEFGHVIGLKDRYSEGIISKVASLFGGERDTQVHAGYERNLMGIYAGALETRNLRDLIAENSPGWTEDDDRVRDWIKHHTTKEIGKISTNNKIRMIKTLMGGWISDDDVETIVRICSSVQNKSEANKIKSNINLRDFSGLGQRMRVRIAIGG